MRTKDKAGAKTLGPRAAQLVAMLHERGRRVFTLADVADITGLQEASARSFVRKPLLEPKRLDPQAARLVPSSTQCPPPRA